MTHRPPDPALSHPEACCPADCPCLKASGSPLAACLAYAEMDGEIRLQRSRSGIPLRLERCIIDRLTD